MHRRDAKLMNAQIYVYPLARSSSSFFCWRNKIVLQKGGGRNEGSQREREKGGEEKGQCPVKFYNSIAERKRERVMSQNKTLIGFFYARLDTSDNFEQIELKGSIKIKINHKKRMSFRKKRKKI